MIRANEAREIAKSNLEQQALYKNIEKAIETAVENSQNSASVQFSETDYAVLPVMVSELYKLDYSTRIDKDKSLLFIHW